MVFLDALRKIPVNLVVVFSALLMILIYLIHTSFVELRHKHKHNMTLHVIVNCLRTGAMSLSGLSIIPSTGAGSYSLVSEYEYVNEKKSLE